MEGGTKDGGKENGWRGEEEQREGGPRRPVSSGRSRRAAIVWARRRALVPCRRCLVVVPYCRVSLSHELGMRGWCGRRVAWWCGRRVAWCGRRVA